MGGESEETPNWGQVPIVLSKAEMEFENYRRKGLNEPSAIEKDFEKAISKIERLKLKAPSKPKKK